MRLAHLFIIANAFAPAGAFACSRCRPTVKAMVYNQHFFGNLIAVLSPVLAFTIIVVAVRYLLDGGFHGTKREGEGKWKKTATVPP